MISAGEPIDRDYRLGDTYRRRHGRVYLTGIQALIRLLLLQRAADEAAGLATGGYVTGYRGSPLAGLDLALAKARRELDAAGIVFRPALNEALAATAVFGTQQVEAEGRATVDGVFAMWYGKGPGVDWAGDAIHHANAYGTSPHGGVLLVAGDDHGAVSSTMAHQSDQTLVAWGLPLLNPADIGEYLELGLYGFALSRFSGAWVGFKAISETVEGAMSVRLPDALPRFTRPALAAMPPGGLHFRWHDPPSVAIEERLWLKREAAIAFARANRVDRVVVPAAAARLGIVTVGKAHGDLMAAFERLGFETAEAIAGLGVRILKVAQSWPLEPAGLVNFARGLRTLLVVEEKRPLVEEQVKSLLYGLPDSRRPTVLGKTDRRGRPLLPAYGELRPERLAPVLADLLRPLVPDLALGQRLARLAPPDLGPAGELRTPWFCAGCPHSSSTRLPEGSQALGGIGCHIMATWMDRGTRGTTQMGGEGVNWLGIAPFTRTRHIFQNLGDGTYYHSGSLAIRQAVAAKVSITFKILFNDAVAMTGGQGHDGPLDVAAITRQVHAEGVARIVVVTDEPDKYPRDHGRHHGFAPGVTVHHRDALVDLERQLREYPGVSVLIYDQTCAAEKRRRRKRGTYPDLARRVFINERVCEGCGDCTTQSNCVAVQPVSTPHGIKRQIDQSACNKDFSCLAGFCPSFVEIEGAEPRAGEAALSAEVEHKLATLPAPPQPATAAADILVAGVGGTGILTVAAVLGMAAHLDGRPVSVLDFTGLAQKGGAVVSHVRLAAPGGRLATGRIGTDQAGLLLAADLVTAAQSQTLGLLEARHGRIVADPSPLATAALIREPAHALDQAGLLQRLRGRAGGGLSTIEARQLALQLLGDTIFANLLLLGAAWQVGLIPLSAAAIDRAIELNARAVAANRRAFAIGRLAMADPAAVATPSRAAPLPASLEEIVAERMALIEAHQSRANAMAYRNFVAAVRGREAVLDPDLPFTRAVARNLAKLMTYKDEYEVARLITDGVLEAELDRRFAPGGRRYFHLAPPLLAGLDPATGRPRKHRFGAWILPLLRLLAKGKVLRGTAFDPFGRTRERRAERRLIADYRAMVEGLMDRLTPENHATAIALAELPDTIRGFGPVKLAAIERYEAARARLLDELTMPPAALALAAE